MEAIYSKIPGEDKCRHIKMAPTGAAANVLGRGTGTIHATLKLPFTISRGKGYEQLSPSKLQDLKEKGLHHLKWVIIDEMSMVGGRMFNYVDNRLREIKGNKAKLFGGVNILACGDLSQLAPVQDAWVFEGAEVWQGTEIGNYNVWKDYCVSYELTRIMRTDNQEFANLQHRLRELRHVENETGKKVLQKMLKEDVEYLNQNCVGCTNDSDYDLKALHILFTNQKIIEHNEKVMKVLRNEGKTIVKVVAKDTIMSLHVDNVTKVSLLKKASEKNSQQTSGLEYSLSLVEGGRIAISTNVDVVNGISNGAMGVVEHFTWTEKGQIHIVWIQLDNPHLGGEYRSHYKMLYRKDKKIKLSWTPIFAVDRRFNIGRKYFEVMRIQFPLTNAFARSLWKVQGVTRYTTTYIDFAQTSTRRIPNGHVVGISRVSDPKFLKILGSFDESLVKKSEKADEEIDRLRRNAIMPLLVPDLQKVNDYKVVFYNMQGLKSHFEDVKSDTNLMEANILMGAETNLNASDPVSNFQIPVVFNGSRFDDSSGKIGRGLIVYAKDKILDLKTYRTNNSSGTIEGMVFKVNCCGLRLTIVNIYRSPHFPMNSLRMSMNDLLESLKEEKNVLVMGDFNTEKNIIEEQTYNYKQVIQGSSKAGVFGGNLCHAYARSNDFSFVGETLYRSFTKSTHHPIVVLIKTV